MALDYAPQNIRVNCICPSFASTPMLEDYLEAQKDGGKLRKAWLAAIPLGRFAKPEEMAHTALYLASDESSYVTGLALEVHGGFFTPYYSV